MIIRRIYLRAVCTAVIVSFFAVSFFAVCAATVVHAGESRVQAVDDGKGQLAVQIDDREAFVYRYGLDEDLVHYYPLRGPSGKPLTIQKTDPYPHHRSFWFADKVRLEGQRAVGFYSALYSNGRGPDAQQPPFRDRVRHVEFVSVKGQGDEATITSKLVWEMDSDRPVLDELREMKVVALDGGQYFFDVKFTLTAAHGNVTFVSDAVHYAWPYVRMAPEFSVQQGGVITNSESGQNQAGTNNQIARWVDYSNAIDGQTEGLAVFSHTDNTHPHRWLTRDYGTFGPRREDERSGKPFTVNKGESTSRRVGIYVHRGNAAEANVAERYRQYIEGELQDGAALGHRER